jgi:hypothetical protein
MSTNNNNQQQQQQQAAAISRAFDNLAKAAAHVRSFDKRTLPLLDISLI